MKIKYEFQYFADGKWIGGSFWESKSDAIAHYAAMVRRFPQTGYRLIERRISEFVIGLDGAASPLTGKAPPDQTQS